MTIIGMGNTVINVGARLGSTLEIRLTSAQSSRLLHQAIWLLELSPRSPRINGVKAFNTACVATEVAERIVAA